MSVIRCPLHLRVVIFEKAKTTFRLFLAVSKISFMSGVGVSAVPLVSEPSNRISPLFIVFVSIVWSHRSRRFAMRVGICKRFGEL